MPVVVALIAVGFPLALGTLGTAFVYSQARYGAAVMAAAAIWVFFAAITACVFFELGRRARRRRRNPWQWFPASLLIVAALAVIFFPNRPLSHAERTACRRGNAVLQVLSSDPHDAEARVLIRTLRPTSDLRPPIRAAVAEARTADPKRALADLRAACV